jgi:hypothetical protein
MDEPCLLGYKRFRQRTTVLAADVREYHKKKKKIFFVCFGRAVRISFHHVPLHRSFAAHIYMGALAIPPRPFALTIINPCEVPLKWSDSSAWHPALQFLLNMRTGADALRNLCTVQH